MHQESRTITSRSANGFSLLELLVAVGIAALVVLTVLGVLRGGLNVLNREELRRVAIGIANERLELFRNVAYDDIGTVGGIPQGSFTPSEIVERGSARYTVTTRVTYVDDPFDDVAPRDAVPNDYKQITVDVAWGANPNQQVAVTTLAAPRGIETTLGGGTIRIHVADANGLPVDGASVQITNSTVSPPVALTLPTDRNGEVLLPGAPASNNEYHVQVHRPGFSTDGTVVPSTENPNPTQPPLTILPDDVTVTTFAIDRLSSIAFTFAQYEDGQPFRRLTTFELRGSRPAGTKPNPAPPPDTVPVYVFPPQTLSTDQGALTISQIPWDTYVFTEQMADYDLAFADPPFPITLLPNTTPSVTVGFARASTHALHLTVRDTAGAPLSGVAASVTDARTDVHEATTPSHGQIYLRNLQPGTAQVVLTHPSFAPQTLDIDIQNRTDVDVRMQPPP